MSALAVRSGTRPVAVRHLPGARQIHQPGPGRIGQQQGQLGIPDRGPQHLLDLLGLGRSITHPHDESLDLRDQNRPVAVERTFRTAP